MLNQRIERFRQATAEPLHFAHLLHLLVHPESSGPDFEWAYRRSVAEAYADSFSVARAVCLLKELLPKPDMLRICARMALIEAVPVIESLPDPVNCRWYIRHLAESRSCKRVRFPVKAIRGIAHANRNGSAHYAAYALYCLYHMQCPERSAVGLRWPMWAMHFGANVHGIGSDPYAHEKLRKIIRDEVSLFRLEELLKQAVRARLGLYPSEIKKFSLAA